MLILRLPKTLVMPLQNGTHKEGGCVPTFVEITMTVKVEMTITVQPASHSPLIATRGFSPLPSFWMMELKNSPKFIKKLKKPCQIKL